MFRAQAISRRLLPFALAASTAAMSLPASAAPYLPLPRALVRAELEAPASVLGLEGSDTKAAEDLTAALRRAFEKRGYAGGEEITLAELRLTMGCEGNDQACLASGGEALQVRRLIYGSLTSAGGGDYTIDLTILSVTDASVEKNVSRKVKGSELQPDVIDATATAIVNSMFPDETDDGELPVGGTSDSGVGEEPITDEPERPRRKSGLVWGPYKPRPAWKWATFGVSAGLMGLSAIALAVTGIPVAQSNNRKGFLYDRLEEKAEASLMNSSTIDDVNPEVVLDICSDVEGSGGALEKLDESDGVATPGVRNVEVGRECRKGQAWANVATASGIALGVFTVTTAIFTTLLFVHKESPAVNAMVRRKVHIGATPDLEGRGVSFTGGFKF
jgi:hypothetical protein